ncbi:MAG: HPP family protein [Planctomycetota bacterium]|jgi:CBS-domain-containing membrane protein
MARKFRDEIREVKAHWKNYVFQSLLATVSLFCVLIFLEHAEEGKEVVVASLGATAFVVFALPNNLSAQPRNVIGGHIVGLVCGFVGHWLLNTLPNPDYFIAEAGIHAITVGLAIFIMVVFDFEHPPAAGTALGAAIGGPGERLIISVLFFAIVFTVIRLLMRKHLRDLK